MQATITSLTYVFGNNIDLGGPVEPNALDLLKFVLQT